MKSYREFITLIYSGDVFSDFERLLKKHILHYIIQSIAHLKL